MTISFKESLKYEKNMNYTPISEPRFSVFQWGTDSRLSLMNVWWRDKKNTLTLNQLKKACSVQICSISQLYIPPGKKSPDQEIYTVSELRTILKEPKATLKRLDENYAFIIDLRPQNNTTP